MVKVGEGATETQARVARLVGALLRMKEKCQMKPEEPIYRMV